MNVTALQLLEDSRLEDNPSGGHSVREKRQGLAE